ncbi:hypothetical protein [Pseudolysobacter antarcticus]|uniref:hypothetical protein n=1 Tax=Pseudolysobacter antarcticus TaxID=2511995 RepID=UPI00101F1C53|nr:hypothetical protein [Pseudolysobacter antarcticus]
MAENPDADFSRSNLQRDGHAITGKFAVASIMLGRVQNDVFLRGETLAGASCKIAWSRDGR